MFFPLIILFSRNDGGQLFLSTIVNMPIGAILDSNDMHTHTVCQLQVHTEHMGDLFSHFDGEGHLERVQFLSICYK